MNFIIQITHHWKCIVLIKKIFLRMIGVKC
jgi:hypothetical protein